jgi:hypothetical protein
MELDEQMTDLAMIYKVNQKQQQWEIDAIRHHCGGSITQYNLTKET